MFLGTPTEDTLPNVQTLFAQADTYFATQLQKFQFFDKYSRYSYELGRRETWPETVKRTVLFLRELSQNKLSELDYDGIENAILKMDVMPSMRALAMAGEPARRQNLALYNCTALPVIDWDCFVEALIISMSGGGVGFSVENQFVSQLPVIQPKGNKTTIYTIDDTTEGWAEALRFGLYEFARGNEVLFDFSQIRPAGTPLRVKGGQASGPEPLESLLNFARTTFNNARGRKLTTLEAHDLMCMVGSAAVSGGVRRTAMLSLFDWDDELMRHCKDGDFATENPQRWNANNSVVWPNRKLTQEEVSTLFQTMVDGGNGEPGIFNRRAGSMTRPARRDDATWLVNPCGEILLNPFELCNLTSAVARPTDTALTLAEKVYYATIIGTIQSMATHFPGLRPEWKANAERERLLGVSLDGQMDSRAAQDPTVQEWLKQIAVATNKAYAEKLGIAQSASITCVKPSGNSSQLLNCSSGLHARWSPYYRRNVRVSAHSPLYKVLKASGVPMSPDNGQTEENANTYVIHFVVQSPKGTKTLADRSALEQCNYWLQNKQKWTEHNPSITVTYQPHEVEAVKQWIFDNQDYVGGMAFLPQYNSGYAQLPYEEIDQETYEREAAAFPVIEFWRLPEFEHRDETTAAQEVACLAGACDITF